MTYTPYPLIGTQVYYDDNKLCVFDSYRSIPLTEYHNSKDMMYVCGARWRFVYPFNIIQEYTI